MLSEEVLQAASVTRQLDRVVKPIIKNHENVESLANFKNSQAEKVAAKKVRESQTI